MKEKPRDLGLTVIELLVAIGIFTIVVGVFMASLVAMTQTTSRAQVVADSADELRRVYQRMDKEIRTASAINLPGAGSVPTSIYVEYRTTTVPPGADPLCTQWRYNSVTARLERRTWNDNAAALDRTEWVTMATRVRNDLTSTPRQEPFTLLDADGITIRQRLSVDLYAGVISRSPNEAAVVRSVFTARNSSVGSRSDVCLVTGDRSS